jgi:hypothetical protein
MNENESVVPLNTAIMVRKPKEILAEATLAANALADVIKNKQKPVIFNGEQYLEFEDWQTCGKFYGLTAKISWTRPMEIGGAIGFEAGADVIDNKTGQIVSSAEAMCLNDEDKWSKRTKYEWVKGKREKVGEVPVPLFQLRSMAQTRACAKALRNVLAWVVVLAGFRPNVAEEITGDEFQNGSPKADPPATPTTDQAQAPKNDAPKSAPKQDDGGDVFDTLENELYDFCRGDAAAMQEKLQELTAFPGKDKDTGEPTGKMVPGKRFVSDLREKGKTAWAGSALKKLRAEVGR